MTKKSKNDLENITVGQGFMILGIIAVVVIGLMIFWPVIQEFMEGLANNNGGGRTDPCSQVDPSQKNAKEVFC